MLVLHHLSIHNGGGVIPSVLRVTLRLRLTKYFGLLEEKINGESTLNDTCWGRVRIVRYIIRENYPKDFRFNTEGTACM